MKFINSLFKMFQEQKFENRHLQKPYLASEEDDAFMKAARDEIMSSSYYQHSQLLKEKVVGKFEQKSPTRTEKR